VTEENKQEPQRNLSSRDIQSTIDETRDALSGDIKALGDKVSPAHIKQEAKQAVKTVRDTIIDKAGERAAEVADSARELKDAAVDKARELKDTTVEKAAEVKDAAVETAQQAAETVSETFDDVASYTRRAGSTALSFASQNAVPLGLIGLGAGWLLANQRRQRSAWDESAWDGDEWDDYEQSEYPRELAYATGDDYAYRAGSSRAVSASEPGSGLNPGYPARGRAPRPAAKGPRSKGDGSARAGARRVGERVRERGHEAYERAGHAVAEVEHKLVEGAQRSRGRVQDQYQRAQRATREFAQANPLMLALGTLVAGIGIGLVLPTSTREDELLASTRNRIRSAVSQAKDAAEDVGRVAKQTATDTWSRASGSTH
jgi:gas vesicle protein